MMILLSYVLLGVIAGAFSGLVGIGGGVLIVPALVLLFGLSQHEAQGTTLALLVPPIGFLAAYHYWKEGYVDLKIAAVICVGFFIGGWFGAKLATSLSSPMLTKVFGVCMLIISLRMILSK